MNIKIAIADDHPLVVSGLRNILPSYPHIQLIATYADGEKLLTGLEQELPDVLILDIHLPGRNGDELVPVILKKYPDLKILTLTNFDEEQELDAVIKAAIAHFWFVTIHPFDDGNGRIARAIADMQLARADQSKQRFYSMSAQIQKERNDYYDILESSQKGGLDITEWLEWFLDCLYRSMEHTDQTINKIIDRGHFWETHREMDFNARQQKMLQSLLDDFFGKLNVSKWAKMTKTSTDTALRDIQDLVKKDVLEQEGSGRNTSYRLKTRQ